MSMSNRTLYQTLEIMRKYQDMDTKKRLFFKAVTWQICGLLSMTVVGLLITGSFSTGGWIAIAGAILGFVSYFLHELVWSKGNWGKSLPNRPNYRAGSQSN